MRQIHGPGNSAVPSGGRSTRLRAFSILAAMALAASHASAQEITARIELHVEDGSGRGVADAVVRLVRGPGVTPVSTGETDKSGELRLYLLPPGGDYFLVIVAQGSGEIRSGPVDLEPGRLARLRVVLPREGEATMEVIIEPEQNTVDTTDPRTATSFGAESIERAAVLGRLYTGILTFSPGVTDTDMDGSPNVQGARETGLQHRLDGADVTDPASGTGGMNLNFEIIEEIEVIPAGAGAAFGRADGGFTNIITKSGGNDLDVSLRLTWRNSLLENSQEEQFDDTFVRSAPASEDFDESRMTLTAGGPILRDRLWYFASAHRVESTITSDLGSADLSRTQEGWTTFAKITWQPAPDHRLSFTAVADPRRYDGLFDSYQGGQEQAALWKQGGTGLQARWSWILRPDMFVETSLSRLDSGVEIEPDSNLFHEIDIELFEDRGFGRGALVALLPTRECSTDGTAAGFIPNCDPSLGKTSIYQADLVNGGATGPLWFRGEDTRIRSSVRADLTWALDLERQEHLLKTGFEGSVERFDDDSIYNPFFQNLYSPCTFCVGPGGVPIPNAVTGVKIMSAPYPTRDPQGADGNNQALYLGDTWKAAPNLSIVAGLRLDRESLEAPGYESFDPLEEKRKSIAIVEDLCVDANRVAATSGQSNAGQSCNAQGRIPGTITFGRLVYTMDAVTPARLRRYDVDLNGVYDSGVDRINGLEVWRAHLTNPVDRSEDDFEIDNVNWSPRVGLAWDPWADGRTKLFSTWGRYYDRLFLAVAAQETAPLFVNFTFEPDPVSRQFEAGSLSRTARSSSAQQVDRHLETPHTDVFTLGIEREVAPEWALRATYVQRLAWDLLDDSDVNHIRCSDFDHALGIDPELVCSGGVLPNGKVFLDKDLFGNASNGLQNGVTDLYVVSPFFNQILRVESSGSAKYRGVTLEAIRRPWRGWQLALAYTYSRAEGEGLSFTSPSGNDPAAPGEADLDFDQRHRIVLYGTAALPRRTDFGWSVRWESGTPYSVTESVADADDAANVTIRAVYPTGERNDQRNGGFWAVDGRVAKHFTLSRVTASVELAVRNLLDQDDTTISGFEPSSTAGPALAPGAAGLAQPGRTWEAGVVFSY